MKLSVREIEEKDIPNITNYWLNSDPEFMKGMGVDMSKMPDRNQWMEMLSVQIRQKYEEKKSYCIICLLDGEAIGHSNVNNIVFAKEAFMHLHLWYPDVRKSGMGSQLVKMTLPYFFGNLKLERIYCQPYALNPAPNKTLEKVGFKFVKEYITIPGYLNFEQSVKLWEMSYDDFRKLNKD